MIFYCHFLFGNFLLSILDLRNYSQYQWHGSISIQQWVFAAHRTCALRAPFFSYLGAKRSAAARPPFPSWYNCLPASPSLETDKAALNAQSRFASSYVNSALAIRAIEEERQTKSESVELLRHSVCRGCPRSVKDRHQEYESGKNWLCFPPIQCPVLNTTCHNAG